MEIPDAFEWATYGVIKRDGGFAELPWCDLLTRKPQPRRIVERAGEPWPSGVTAAPSGAGAGVVSCSAVVDYDEAGGHEVTCAEPAEFLCAGEPRCHQHAHDWLDELEPGTIQEVCVPRELGTPT